MYVLAKIVFWRKNVEKKARTRKKKLENFLVNSENYAFFMWWNMKFSSFFRRRNGTEL